MKGWAAKHDRPIFKALVQSFRCDRSEMLVEILLVARWREIINARLTALTVKTQSRHQPTDLAFLQLRVPLWVKTRHLRENAATPLGQSAARGRYS